MVFAPSCAMRVLLPFLLCFPLVAADGDGVCVGDAPQHTGYLNAGGNVDYFYYLATSRSATPNVEPLVLWLTGGPGCSSILALFVENGPCRPTKKDADGRWGVARNPSSWNEAANVLWVDQPVGVGYSSPGVPSEQVETERQVADRMLDFMLNFYRKFPQYLHVPLFVTGESYGGHYVPAVASRMLQWQHRGVGSLAGIAIGNGMVDAVLQYRSKADMAFTGGKGGSLTKGVVDKPTYEFMKEHMSKCEDGILACRQFRTEEVCMMSFRDCAINEMLPVQMTGLNPYDLRKPCTVPPLCIDIGPETQFLNDNNVKALLGVPVSRKWEACNMTSMIPFVMSGDELEYYHEKVATLLLAGVHVLVYAGDTDFMVDWVGCKSWVEHLRWGHRAEWASAPNLPFRLGNTTVGMKQTFQGLTFMQIYNSGHMVPMDQPEVALEMIQQFISTASTAHPHLPAGFNRFFQMDGLSLPWLPSAGVFFAAAAAGVLSLAGVCRRQPPGPRMLQENYHLMA